MNLIELSAAGRQLVISAAQAYRFFNVNVAAPVRNVDKTRSRVSDENRQAFVVVVVVVTGVFVLMNLDIEDMRRVTATFDARNVQKE